MDAADKPAEADEPDEEVAELARYAYLASEYLALLRMAGVPDSLAHQMVRDWHYIDLGSVQFELARDDDE